MIERMEVTPGRGTVIRYGAVTAWAASDASPALVSFLAQSAQNLGPSPTGGRDMADHIAEVLRERDPEPDVAFAVIGPNGADWAAVLHGPVQVWDGVQWLSPRATPGWMVGPIDPRPAVTVGAAGTSPPPGAPDSMMDFERGVVPGAGFVLMPRRAGARMPSDPEAVGAPYMEPEAAGRAQADPARTAVLEMTEPDGLPTSALDVPEPTEALPVLTPEPEPAPEQVPEPEPAAPVGPQGALDLRRAKPVTAPPLPIGRGPDQAVPGAPVVAGVMCARGHLNRPGVTACVRCSVAIPAEAAYSVSGTRPALGVLIGDDATVYRLDRGFLVGSDPGRDPTVTGGLARPLLLSGPDVSAAHAEIRLHDWDVVVTDRASAAGTCVFEPGATAWRRLAPFDPCVMPPGTHVAFGQRIITYVTPWVLTDGMVS